MPRVRMGVRAVLEQPVECAGREGLAREQFVDRQRFAVGSRRRVQGAKGVGCKPDAGEGQGLPLDREDSGRELRPGRPFEVAGPQLSLHKRCMRGLHRGVQHIGRPLVGHGLGQAEAPIPEGGGNNDRVVEGGRARVSCPDLPAAALLQDFSYLALKTEGDAGGLQQPFADHGIAFLDAVQFLATSFQGNGPCKGMHRLGGLAVVHTGAACHELID
mmetsp:Transcript_136879/g.237845  ORF Transcript_136879/g.237845 Transcript_136879/m.237845 type:complete len:216 (+) Transcript_136879:262-909(+)